MSAPSESVDPGIVQVRELVDLDSIGPEHRPPTPAELRAALPRGWVLEPDGEHARRDVRLFFRESWILLVGLLSGAGIDPKLPQDHPPGLKRERP